MSDSEDDVYLHLVWATKYREPLITPEVERSLYRIISAEAKKLKCPVMAIGGIEDHVHLLVRFNRTETIAKLMNQVKGVSSTHLTTALYPDGECLFRWQPGYGVFSVSPNHVKAVIAYIRNQKQHHANGETRDSWERTGYDESETPDNTLTTGDQSEIKCA